MRSKGAALTVPLGAGQEGHVLQLEASPLSSLDDVLEHAKVRGDIRGCILSGPVRAEKEVRHVLSPLESVHEACLVVQVHAQVLHLKSAELTDLPLAGAKCEPDAPYIQAWHYDDDRMDQTQSQWIAGSLGKLGEVCAGRGKADLASQATWPPGPAIHCIPSVAVLEMQGQISASHSGHACALEDEGSELPGRSEDVQKVAAQDCQLVDCRLMTLC